VGLGHGSSLSWWNLTGGTDSLRTYIATNKVVQSGLVLNLDAGASTSYPPTGRVYSTGWSGSVVNPTNSFDGSLSTGTGLPGGNATATYTFAGGLSVSGTVRIYVAFGASSMQVSGLPNVIVVDGTDVSAKMAAAGLYLTVGWIDVTTEVGSVFNTIVLTATSGRSNPSIRAVEVNGQILVDSSTWTDLSGNGNTGTLTNGPTYSSANGGSIVFDGTNDYVTLSNTSNLRPGAGDFTIEAWIYKTGTSGGNVGDVATIYGTAWSGGSAAGAWILYANENSGTKITFAIWNTGIVTSTTTILTNQWYHIVVSRIGTTVRLYINNVLESTGTSSANAYNSTYPIYVGLYTDPNGFAGYFNGRIPIVRLYNGKGLTATEITQNYNALRGRFGL
jgi:hypothetical protein